MRTARRITDALANVGCEGPAIARAIAVEPNDNRIDDKLAHYPTTELQLKVALQLGRDDSALAGPNRGDGFSFRLRFTALVETAR
jgi:hypothetical protein